MDKFNKGNYKVITKVGDYAIYNQLPIVPKVISGGIGEDITFEEKMIAEYSAEVTCYDFTDKAKTFITAKINNGLTINYIEKALSASKEYKYFKIPIDVPVCSTSEFLSHENNKNYDIEKADSIDIYELIKIHGHIDILKLDIEGSEYDFLLAMDSFCYQNIDQICGEFHSYRIPQIQKGYNIKLINHMQNLGYNFQIIDYSHHIYLFFKS